MRYWIWLRAISTLLAGSEFTGTWSLLEKAGTTNRQIPGVVEYWLPVFFITDHRQLRNWQLM